MDKSTKEKTWEAFRDSTEYTKATYLIFQLLSKNIDTMISTIELYSILIKKLDDGSINHSFNSRHLEIIKQHILLDSNSKIMSIIETLLALVYAINEGYNKIPEILTYYQLTVTNSSISKIRNKELNLRKIVGLCDISKLDVTDEEKKLLANRYQTTCETVQIVLEKFVNFFEKYKIIHGKNKHGFSFLTGVSTDSPNLKFENSMIMALDRQKWENMPADSVNLEKRDLGEDIPWFTTESILKIDQKLFDEISSILSDLRFLTRYVINNHLSYAENCGVGYLPFQYVDGDEKFNPGVFFGDKFLEDTQKIFDNMVLRIAETMLVPKRMVKFNVISKNDHVIKSLQDNIITNIWSKIN